MPDPTVRPMRADDRDEVAELIYLSTNSWYETHGHPACFTGGPAATDVFYQVYHTLPGSSGLVAEDASTGRLIGSCFCHVRPTHVSLGIMNAHPNHFGIGAARALLDAGAADNPRRVRGISGADIDGFEEQVRRNTWK